MGLDGMRLISTLEDEDAHIQIQKRNSDESECIHTQCVHERVAERERNTWSETSRCYRWYSREEVQARKTKKRETKLFLLFSFRLRTNSIASLILIFPLYKMSHRTISLFSSPVRFIILERVSGISRHSQNTITTHLYIYVYEHCTRRSVYV